MKRYPWPIWFSIMGYLCLGVLSIVDVFFLFQADPEQPTGKRCIQKLGTVLMAFIYLFILSLLWFAISVYSFRLVSSSIHNLFLSTAAITAIVYLFGVLVAYALVRWRRHGLHRAF